MSENYWNKKSIVHILYLCSFWNLLELPIHNNDSFIQKYNMSCWSKKRSFLMKFSHHRTWFRFQIKLVIGLKCKIDPLYVFFKIQIYLYRVSQSASNSMTDIISHVLWNCSMLYIWSPSVYMSTKRIIFILSLTITRHRFTNISVVKIMFEKEISVTFMWCPSY